MLLAGKLVKGKLFLQLTAVNFWVKFGQGQDKLFKNWQIFFIGIFLLFTAFTTFTDFYPNFTAFTKIYQFLPHLPIFYHGAI
jgi:hypothetical protein